MGISYHVSIPTVDLRNRGVGRDGNTSPKVRKSQHTARKRYEACQDHVWKARGLARVLMEMAWGCEHNVGADNRLRVMFLHASDLRTTMDVLIGELLQAESLLGDLENNICADED